MKKSILVLASESDDYIYKESQKKPIRKKGGPAFFIRKTFDDLGLKYKLAQASSAKVEIKITNHEEVGRILKSDKIAPPKKITESNILISTIGPNALNLNFLSEYDGDVFLDIQGFVRQERSTQLGAKKVWKNSGTIINHLRVLKGTSTELQFLPKDVLEKARKKILIKTRGDRGVTLWEYGKKINLAPPKKIKTKDTIGAGDVFMAAFVYKFVHTKKAQNSARFALEYASSFLQKKV